MADDVLPDVMGGQTMIEATPVVLVGQDGVPVDGGLVADDLRSTSTRSQVVSSASSGVLIAANANRKGVSICNTDLNALSIVCGAVAATTANADYVIPTGETWESPFGYTGEIRGIWAADGSGAANVVEYS